MEFKSHALKLESFLASYQDIYSAEVLNRIGFLDQDYPKEWIDLLRTLSEEERYQFDKKETVQKLQGSGLQKVLDEIDLLTNVAFKDSLHKPLPIELWAWRGVKEKKKHEIQIMAPVIKDLFQDKKFKYIIDIGGGVGHLSRILAHYYDISCISIDQNTEFQEIGKNRLKKDKNPTSNKSVEFVNFTFGENESSEEYQKRIHHLFHEKSLNIGLHTCGNLANVLIDQTIRYDAHALLSFGCCYYRMNTQTDFPKSQFYKESNLFKLNLFGLTLATRNHRETDWENYVHKKQVKDYRYAFHLLLMKKFNIHDAYDIGECHNREYWRPWSEYALMKLDYLNLTHTLSSSDLENFYQDSQEELEEFYLYNLMRWRFGRALEVYILLDRCLWLEENNYEVEFNQYFDETKSPRNLGILARKKLF